MQQVLVVDARREARERFTDVFDIHFVDESSYTEIEGSI